MPVAHALRHLLSAYAFKKKKKKKKKIDMMFYTIGIKRHDKVVWQNTAKMASKDKSSAVSVAYWLSRKNAKKKEEKKSVFPKPRVTWNLTVLDGSYPAL